MMSPRLPVQPAFNSGTRVRCPAASEEMPTICTSFSTACRAASSGVANSGPMSTSKPRSAKAGGDHLLAAIVTILADFGDQDARTPAVVLDESSTWR